MNAQVPARNEFGINTSCAVPLVIVPVANALQFGELNVTAPVTAFDEVTVAISVKLEPCATFPFGAEIVVVVEAGGPPVLAPAPPPQPIARVTRQISPSPQAAFIQRSLLLGTTSIKIVASPASKLSIDQTRPGGNLKGVRQQNGAIFALSVLDGARVVIVSVAVAGALLLSVTEAGEIEHVAPGMLKLLPQVNCTVLVLLDVGVIVTVDVPL